MQLKKNKGHCLSSKDYLVFFLQRKHVLHSKSQFCTTQFISGLQSDVYHVHVTMQYKKVHRVLNRTLICSSLLENRNQTTHLAVANNEELIKHCCDANTIYSHKTESIVYFSGRVVCIAKCCNSNINTYFVEQSIAMSLEILNMKSITTVIAKRFAVISQICFAVVIR